MMRTIKIISLILVFGAGLLLCGCDLFQKTQKGVCSGVTCSDHGVCVPDEGGRPECRCDKGYRPQGFECVPDEEDLCDGIDCSGHGTCRVVKSGQPFCDCDEGYHAESLTCVEDTGGLCEGVTCSGYGTCRLDDKNEPYCDCVEGYHAVGTYCVKDEPLPCDGVDCSGHGTCYEDSFGKARCQCEAGYHEQGLECVKDGGCDPVALRLEALERGTVILKGVTLPASTEIPEINANPDTYADQHIQVEGLVTYVCPGGNRVALKDAEGNYFTVTADFNLNMVPVIEPGTYMVADGMYRLFFCRRGRHLNIGQHGARVGTIKCNSDGP